MGQGTKSYLMLMANSAASFTRCRTKNVPSERLVRILSAPARSMGPAYLPRHTKGRGPHSPRAAPCISLHGGTFSQPLPFLKLVTSWVQQPLDTVDSEKELLRRCPHSWLGSNFKANSAAITQQRPLTKTCLNWQPLRCVPAAGACAYNGVPEIVFKQPLRRPEWPHSDQSARLHEVRLIRDGAGHVCL